MAGIRFFPGLARISAYEKETRGGPPFDPTMMVCLLLYAYCVGVFASRKIALACKRNLAFLAIVGADRLSIQAGGVQGRRPDNRLYLRWSFGRFQFPVLATVFLL